MTVNCELLDKNAFVLPADDSDNDVWLAALAGVALGVLLGLVVSAIFLRRPPAEALLVEQLERAVAGQAAAEREIDRLEAEALESEVRSQKAEVRTREPRSPLHPFPRSPLPSSPLQPPASSLQPSFGLAWAILVVAAFLLGLAWWVRQIVVAVWRALPGGLRGFGASVWRAVR